MAYQRPLVMVFQEYAKQSVSTQTATLYPCIIGPCYHIVDVDEDPVLSFAGDYTLAGLEDTPFPSNIAGATIDPASVVLKLKDIKASVNAASFVVASISNNSVVFDAGAYPTYLAVGDVCSFTDVTTQLDPLAVAGEYKVIGVNPDTLTVLLNKSPLVLTGTDFTMEFYREYTTLTLTDTNSTLTIDAVDGTIGVLAVTIIGDEEDFLVTSAKLYVGYRALRTDLAEINTVFNTDEATGLLGKIDTHSNPLGLGTMITLANTSVGVKVIGVKTNDLAGYTEAKDMLESYPDVYSLVPLSQDSAILSMFKLHAEQMSLPINGNWRVAIGNTIMPTVALLQTGTAGNVLADGDGDIILLKDVAANFMANNVSSGDVLEMTLSEGVTFTYTVATVISEDLLSIATTTPFDDDGFAVLTEYAYTINKELNKTEQAEAIAEVSASFGSSRCIHTWPDQCVIDSVTVPGYYLSCTVAGAAGGLPSHHPFTRLSIGGISRVYNSSDYFNQAQLDIIADGGTFIFTQSNPQAAPMIRHQLTTDRSTIEFQEFSFVKNFDYVSILCKDVLDQFLGKYNITPPTLAVLETAVRSVLESLKLANLPKIGSPVLGYTVVSVAQMEDIRDRVEMYVNVKFPYVLNTIGLHLVSQ